MTNYKEPLPRPRKVSRLKQLSKSNRLLRRYYSGKAPTPQAVPIKITHVDQEIFGS